MKTGIILTFLAIFQTQQLATANEFLKSPSTWYGEMKRNGKVVTNFCLQVTEPLIPIVDRRPAPKKCATFSATMSSPVTASRGDLVSGYFCQDEAKVGFFYIAASL
jgi:hypothetical protein